jgi:predicted dithiol-disulfide oxidoreductase (DUF899 family)
MNAAVPAVASRQEWTEARIALLSREKELTRLRDEVAAQRRSLPWVAVEKPYRFDTGKGPATLADLFDGRGQLAVYHFMFGADWQEGCPSCSFWLDSLDGIAEHLRHRDVTLVAVSRAPLGRIQEYRTRMGWTLPWVSSAASDFNLDYGVSFTAEQQAGTAEAVYNYRPVASPGDEHPGMSVFARDGAGTVYHTYSCYSRGLDPINSGYQVLDLVPRGRDEDGLPWTMAWLRRHDAYDADGATS